MTFHPNFKFIMFICDNCFFTQAEAQVTIRQLNVPENVIDDLRRFISETYSNDLPNSLLIAQAFILKHPNYGKEFGLPSINYAIEDGIKRGLF